ncbi:hypothetical protein ACLOJK_005826 [Asimina triloba]
MTQQCPSRPIVAALVELVPAHAALALELNIASTMNVGGSLYLPGLVRIHEQSLVNMHEVLQQQTEAIARLGNVLRRNMIIMSKDLEMLEEEVQRAS